jgi:hypothetical protein
MYCLMYSMMLYWELKLAHGGGNKYNICNLVKRKKKNNNIVTNVQ